MGTFVEKCGNYLSALLCAIKGRQIQTTLTTKHTGTNTNKWEVTVRLTHSSGCDISKLQLSVTSC